jgi:hypothetical protein
VAVHVRSPPCRWLGYVGHRRAAAARSPQRPGDHMDRGSPSSPAALALRRERSPSHLPEPDARVPSRPRRVLSTASDRPARTQLASAWPRGRSPTRRPGTGLLGRRGARGRRSELARVRSCARPPQRQATVVDDLAGAHLRRVNLIERQRDHPRERSGLRRAETAAASRYRALRRRRRPRLASPTRPKQHRPYSACHGDPQAM